MSSEIMVNIVLPSSARRILEPFHVVDLLGHVGGQQNRTINERAWDDIRQCYSSQPHREACEPAEAAFEQDEVAGGQRRAIADVETIPATNRKPARRRAADDEGLEIAGPVETAFGKSEQGTAEPGIPGGEGQGFEAPCCSAA